jgi:hypothetical protein
VLGVAFRRGPPARADRSSFGRHDGK